MATAVTKSRSVRLPDMLWAWRRLCRGDGPIVGNGSGAVGLASLSDVERSLVEVVSERIDALETRHALAAFFGLAQTPATQGELAREQQVSLRTVQSRLSAGRRTLDSIPWAGPGLSEAGWASVRNHLGTMSPALRLTALTRAWSRVELDRADGRALAFGLLSWQARSLPFSTSLGPGAIHISQRMAGLRALRRAEVAIAPTLAEPPYDFRPPALDNSSLPTPPNYERKSPPLPSRNDTLTLALRPSSEPS